MVSLIRDLESSWIRAIGHTESIRKSQSDEAAADDDYVVFFGSLLFSLHAAARSAGGL